MTTFPIFNEPVLQAICDILGDTNSGLTGSEIGHLLNRCGIEDPWEGTTKRKRLYEALRQKQQLDRCGNSVAAFILQAISPASYIGRSEVHKERLRALNQALSFAGLVLGDDGQFRTTNVARTLTEAQQRADQLRQELISRQVHTDVLKFCRPELLQENYFHAVFEATKSVADKIRDLSGIDGDGAPLVDKAFGGSHPMLAFNTLQTHAERSEHTGIMNLLKGLFGTFRNTTAHAPKIKWKIDQQDALDILSLASLLHRRLDQCVRTRFEE